MDYEKFKYNCVFSILRKFQKRLFKTKLKIYIHFNWKLIISQTMKFLLNTLWGSSMQRCSIFILNRFLKVTKTTNTNKLFTYRAIWNFRNSNLIYSISKNWTEVQVWNLWLPHILVQVHKRNITLYIPNEGPQAIKTFW